MGEHGSQEIRGVQVPHDWPVKKRGDEDQGVRTLQHLLNHHGSTLAPDGVFGRATEEAVIAFQTSGSLPADGLVNGATWEGLVVELAMGDSGEAVKALQVQLYVRGTIPTVDGEFGPRTDISVRRFQVFLNLQADGVARTPTWRTLVATEYVPMAGQGPGRDLQGEDDWRARLLAKIRPTGPNFKLE